MKFCAGKVLILCNVLCSVAAVVTESKLNATTEYYMPEQPVDSPESVEILRFFKRIGLKLFGMQSEFLVRKAKEEGKFQDIVPSSVPFPCSTVGARSVEKPKNVKKVRPGDIDIIGALGDSMIAGNGHMATDSLTLLTESRGITAIIGGQGTWRQYLTLPNILKVFNPNLIGYSLGDAITADRASQFNVGEAGALSIHTPYMAKLLVKRIVKDSRVNVTEDWKLITVLIGANDFCSEICTYENPEVAVQKHKRDLLSVLRILRDHLPRTIINFMPTPHMKLLLKYNHPPLHCVFSHLFECRCMYGLAYRNNLKLYDEVMTKWLIAQFEIIMDPEFDRDDFTIVLQPMSMGYGNPGNLGPTGRTDYTYTGHDCFHFSQKGSAHVSNLLWNNIMEPVGQKTVKTNIMKPLDIFKCPSEERPYIFTNHNSGIANLTEFRDHFIEEVIKQI